MLLGSLAIDLLSGSPSLEHTFLHGLGHGDVCCVGRPVESSVWRFGTAYNRIDPRS